MSLRKSIKRVSQSFFGKGETKGPDDNKIVQYSGVSLLFLQHLKEDLFNEEVAKGVELYLLTEDIEVKSTSGSILTLSIGTTIRVAKKLRDGSMKCRVQFKGAFSLPKDSPVKLKARNQWTTEDICEFVVLEETRPEKLFYLDLMQENEVGKRFQGAFLSQARKSCFAELVDSLLEYYKGKDLSKQFVWFDVFCANQPLLVNRDDDLPHDIQANRESLLREGLHDAISKFDERLIYFNSWANPYPIQRAWCVWEIFGCAKSEKSLDIIFRPGEDEAFIDTLLCDREEVTRRIMSLDLEKAESFVAADKEGIDQAVEEQIGYHKLNVVISALVQKWLKKFAIDVVDRQRKMPNSKSSFRFSNILYETGIFFTEQLGLYEDAMQLLQESLAMYKQLSGEDSLNVAVVLDAIGDVFDHKGEYDSALRMYEKSLEIEMKQLGRNHSSVAATLHCIASVLQAKGEYDAALKQFEEVLRINEKSYGGRDHPEVAATLHSKGSVLLAKGEYDAALEQFEEVLRITEKSYGGMDHPDVAATLHSIASVLQDKGEYDAALKQFEKVLRIEEKSYGGRDNAPVAATLHKIASVLQDKGEYEAALKQFEEVLRIKEKSYGGRDHPDVAVTQISLASCLNDLNRPREALEYLENASDTLHSKPQSECLALLFCIRGTSRRLQSCFDLSRSDLERARCIRRDELKQPDHHVRVEQILFELGRTLQCLGDVGDAAEVLEGVLSSRLDRLGDRNHIRVKEVERALST